MLRYIERVGLLEPERSEAGYRLFGAAQLQRLRTLRELLAQHEVGLSEMAFALRVRSDERLRTATDDWFEARPERPADIPAADWLRWEQDKHERLLAAARTMTPTPQEIA